MTLQHVNSYAHQEMTPRTRCNSRELKARERSLEEENGEREGTRRICAG